MNNELAVVSRTAAIASILGITSIDVLALHKIKLIESLVRLGNSNDSDMLKSISASAEQIDNFINN